MTMLTPGAAGEFLADVADRLALHCDSAAIRTTAERACGGRLNALGPDGRHASGLTKSGVPFEASVSGGRGKLTPAVRYTTETATQEMKFESRVAAQLAAIRDLVRWLPNGGEGVADMLHAFVETLYPDSAKVPAGHRSATWIGVVHHADAPHHVARLKVYGSVVVPGALDRLCSTWPGFAGLVPMLDRDNLIRLAGVAIEVDAAGQVNHKVYLRTVHDAAVPMKLVRYFGDPAWEILSELVRCGVHAASIYEHNYFICCARGTGEPAVGLYLAKRHDDFSQLVYELASRHHGTTQAVDALTQAAESLGATWNFSMVGLGFSAEYGINKLNVYGTPTWGSAQDTTAARLARQG